MTGLARHSRTLLFWLAALLCTAARPQSLLFPTEYLFDVSRQRAIAFDTTANIHTAVQPYVYEFVQVDTFKNLKWGADNFFDKLLYENLIEVKHTDNSSGYPRKFNFVINPIVDFGFGKDQKDSASAQVQVNTRGFWLKGELGKKLRFESAFIENQAFPPEYVYAYGKANGLVPGQGRWKTFKKTGFDYASAYGVLNYEVNKNFTIRAGHGKQKVGNGYRSLLLSDNAFNYPYLQFIIGFLNGKLQYSQTYALLMNLYDGGVKTPPNTEPIFQKKAATFQCLSLKKNKYFSAYLFQGTVWKGTDSNNVMHLSPLYANPLFFTNLAKYGFNSSENHMLVGGGFELSPHPQFHLYNQYVYDGHYVSTKSNQRPSWGMQAGIKYFDVFGVRNLYFQAETNLLNGQVFHSTSSTIIQDYSHYSQLLTTPALLSNEVIGMLSYKYKRFFVQAKYIFQSDNSSKAVLNYFDTKIGYLINQRYNCNLSIGSTTRSFLSGIPGVKADEMQLLYISLRTSLYNFYYDF